MYKTVIVPRISETNAAGHIGLTVIPVWMEAGYDEIIRMFHSEARQAPDLIALNLSLDCKKEVFYGKDVEVLAWISKLGVKSFVVYEEVYQEGNLCASGTTTFIHYNYLKRRPEPIPPDLRLKLGEHLKPE